MNCFQLIKTVLDEIYDEIDELDEGVRDSLIRDAFDYLSDHYRNLFRSSTIIKYSDPVIRFAYIYRYVTAHANLVARRIELTEPLAAIFDNDRIKVTCIGGGPGSDFLGVLKYMMLAGKTATIRFNLFDREAIWSESWADVEDKVDGLGFRISTHFQRLDITDSVTWIPYRKFVKQSDLFTMTYFMSEVYSRKEQAEPFFDNLFANAKSGAYVLFIDNNSESFYGWFDYLVKKHDLEVWKSHEACIGLPLDEQKYDLGIYFHKFGDPKIVSRIAYRVCMKV